MSKQINKHSEIILIGEGSFVDALQKILQSKKLSVLRIPRTDDVHFLQRGVLVYRGEKHAGKKFLVVLPEEPLLPIIKGLEGTKYVALESISGYPKVEKALILGGDELAVRSALHYGASAVLVSDKNHLLDDYDHSLQEHALRYLRKVGCEVIFNHRPVASITKESQTQLLVATKTTTKKITGSMILIDSSEHRNIDIGLRNYGYDTNQRIQKPLQNRMLVLTRRQLGHSLYDAEILADALIKGSWRRQFIRNNVSRGDVIGFYSVGILEQDISETHIAYRRSLVRVEMPGSDIVGFMKVITTMKKRIVGMSGFLPSNLIDEGLLYRMVQQRAHIDDIAKTIETTSPLLRSYMDMVSELS